MKLRREHPNAANGKAFFASAMMMMLLAVQYSAEQVSVARRLLSAFVAEGKRLELARTCACDAAAECLPRMDTRH